MREEISVKDITLREEYTYIRHESGLTIYVFPKQLSTAYVSLTVHFGSLDSDHILPNGREVHLPDGVAHFLEHKMFESEDHIDTFDKFAAVGASANAYTSNELTSYLFSTTSDISAGLSILLDYVFHPYFTPENIKKEQGIIGQEIGMYEDSPGNRLYYAAMEALYQKHGIRKNICGTTDTIAAITPEMLYECCRSFYVPDNMTLVVCGKTNAETVLSIVDSRLSPRDPAPRPRRIYPTEPEAIFKPEISFRMDIARPMLCLAVKDTRLPEEPEAAMRRSLTMNLLCDLLFGESSEFYNRLYKEGVISQDFSASYESARGCAHFLISCSADDPERVFHLLTEELRLYRSGERIPSFEDFERMRRVHYAEYIKDFDSTEEIAAALLDSVVEQVPIFRMREILDEISYADICRELNTVFEEKSMAKITITPINETIKTK